MYIPEAFREDDPARLAALMAQASFALVVTTEADGVPFATHLPLLHEPAAGAHGTLLGHMARANPQWRHFEAGGQVLAVFSGPHAYVSPSWYQTHPSVPTWNYAAVHAYGRPALLDEAATRALLQRLVATHEAGYEAPWRMELPAKYEAMMLRGIVGFEIPIDRLEGKFKLSQNRDATDRGNVAAKLAGSAYDEARGVARLMRERDG
ncbi:MAG TPA: FMN-binding negative transcriptional regulator [Alphaproteobacteria bacterium]|nr:FMN-binding negative transcriptional regulator [Alphaproteobacteria bacterium]